jgi:hypothetical protein
MVNGVSKAKSWRAWRMEMAKDISEISVGLTRDRQTVVFVPRPLFLGSARFSCRPLFWTLAFYGECRNVWAWRAAAAWRQRVDDGGGALPRGRITLSGAAIAASAAAYGARHSPLALAA